MPTLMKPPSMSDIERRQQNDAWAAFCLVLSGVVVWGGAGVLLARWAGQPLIAMCGILLGAAGGIAAVWVRYGRT